jgi:crotonobetainyl-CoA:carnitine CoA-transferase CaiB-like acyl-CoA transferase
VEILLDGIRILDFTQNLPGPFASQRLAYLGAEVVKVEPLSGESARHIGEKQYGVGLLFLANNRHKKWIALDLKTEEGKQLALRLIEQCDVLMESFRPGVMKRLGLGYEDVISVNPNIIYASISGYGQAGKLAHFASHDLNYMALSGALAQLKDQHGIPIHPTLLWADLIGGMAAAEAILGALIQLERKKRGAYLDLSLFREMSQLMNTHHQIYQVTGRENGPELLAGGTISYGLYRTKDDRTVALAALEPKFWAQFCTAVGKEEWIPLQFTPQSEENQIYLDLCCLFIYFLFTI